MQKNTPTPGGEAVPENLDAANVNKEASAPAIEQEGSATAPQAEGGPANGEASAPAGPTTAELQAQLEERAKEAENARAAVDELATKLKAANDELAELSGVRDENAEYRSRLPALEEALHASLGDEVVDFEGHHVLDVATAVLNRTPPDSAPESIRWFRELAGKIGVAVDKLFTREELTEAIDAVWSEPEEPVEAVNAWEFLSDYVGDGPACAVDPQGHWSANTYNDGAAEITRYTAPNLHNRPAGVRVQGDETIRVDSLSDFIDRLCELRDRSDPIFESSLQRLAQERDAETQRINDESERNEAAAANSIPAPTPDEALLMDAAREYGFSHLPEDQWPAKLAEALGIDIVHPSAEGDDSSKPQPWTYEEILAAVLSKLKAE